MMTFEEQQKRLASVRRLSRVAHKVWSKKSDEAHKLSAFNTWFTPTKHVRDSVQKKMFALWDEGNAAYALAQKLDKAEEKLMALPTIATYESYDGTIKTYVHKGMLPDFTETSEDEKEAMQMLALYYAKKGKTEELPF